MEPREEFAVKLDRIRGLMREQSIQGLLLTRRSNFAWLTCGGQNHVPVATEWGVGSLLVTVDKVYLLSNNIETRRLMEEECSYLPIEPVSYPWHQDMLEKPKKIEQILGGGAYGSDGSGGGKDLSAEIMLLRHPLLPPEIERYRYLGHKAQRILSFIAHWISPGMREMEVAGEMAGACLKEGLEATVRLIAFDDRALNYRHPIPTNRPLQKTAMLVLGARRKGLIVSLSRMVSFGQPDAELLRKHQAVCRVDAMLNLASATGKTLGEILRAGIQQYQIEGYPDEWQQHHQGGLTGYEGRDIRATPDSDCSLKLPAAVAWNPTIAGTKCEDTFLIGENRLENLTYSEDYPQLRVETELGGLERCDILVRS